ncbi:MAG: alpha-E domain-containing protein, partial [Alphaproteobacteria bacterium]|nr:alpha-E domain-containing protein [Alphaproteobacteria bacterium]
GFCATLSGLAQENMTRGTGWLFLDLGRRIERGQFVLNAALGPFQAAPIDWDASMRLALELCDSSITYRWRYLGQLQPAPVLDLVVLDDSNPRAFAFQLRSIGSHLERLGRASGTLVPNPLIELDQDLARVVKMFTGEEKSWRHEGLALAVLREVAEDAERRLEDLSESITRAYFSHVPAAQAVGSSGR